MVHERIYIRHICNDISNRVVCNIHLDKSSFTSIGMSVLFFKTKADLTVTTFWTPFSNLISNTTLAGFTRINCKNASMYNYFLWPHQTGIKVAGSYRKMTKVLEIFIWAFIPDGQLSSTFSSTFNWLNHFVWSKRLERWRQMATSIIDVRVNWVVKLNYSMRNGQYSYLVMQRVALFLWRFLAANSLFYIHIDQICN